MTKSPVKARKISPSPYPRLHFTRLGMCPGGSRITSVDVLWTNKAKHPLHSSTGLYTSPSTVIELPIYQYSALHGLITINHSSYFSSVIFQVSPGTVRGFIESKPISANKTTIWVPQGYYLWEFYAYYFLAAQYYWFTLRVHHAMSLPPFKMIRCIPRAGVSYQALFTAFELSMEIT